MKTYKFLIYFFILFSQNIFCYTVTIKNQLDTQVRITTEYLNPELCKPFTFDVPSKKTIEQTYPDTCCFVKLTADAKNKTYFQFGTGACENYTYIIIPKSSNNDFIIQRDSGTTVDKTV